MLSRRLKYPCSMHIVESAVKDPLGDAALACLHEPQPYSHDIHTQVQLLTSRGALNGIEPEMPFEVANLFRKREKRTSQNVRDMRSPPSANPTQSEPSDDPSQFGMFVLEDKPSDLVKAVDLVAVHGLNGHYLNSWTWTDDAGQKVMWLRDFLPKKFPDARIMSYGYNSAVQFSKNVAGITTFAEQLLEDLKSWRITPEEKNRPIVFICHSLGGLVVKQALVRAHERDRFSELLSQVHGIAFFGTPHRGADLASWATIMGNVLRAASFGTSTNTKFANELKSRSAVLENISASFVERGQNLKILSFYETEKMDRLNTLVVEKSSATLDWPNETSIPLNATHRTLCKFGTENEQRYRTVWSNLQEMIANAIIDETLSAAESSCLSSLYLSDYERPRDRVERPIPGTCSWNLSHSMYQEWLRSQNSSILWVSADPGCGKSVLTSFLVDAQMDSRATVCYFFFKDDNTEQHNARFAVAAVLHQIYMLRPSLIKHALKWNKQKSLSASTSFSTLWEIFVNTLEDERAPNVICLIDALDECQPRSRAELMTALVKYFARPNLHKSQKSHLKLLVTSRPDNSIKLAFRQLPRIRLKGEDETDSISRDVAMVVQANVDRLKDVGLPSSILANLQKQLIDGADRTFLWVTLIIQLLKDALESGASQNQLNAIIRSRDIDEVYTRLLQRSAAPMKAKSMLKIVVAATSPLTLDELCVATAVHWKHKTLNDLEKDLVYPFDNYIRTLCGHFLRIVQGKVYLVHQTAREYLLESHPIEKSGVNVQSDLKNGGSRNKHQLELLDELIDGHADTVAVANARFEDMAARLSVQARRELVRRYDAVLIGVKKQGDRDKILDALWKSLVQKRSDKDENQILEEVIDTLNNTRENILKKRFFTEVLKPIHESRGKGRREFTEGQTEVIKIQKSLKAVTSGLLEKSFSLTEANYYVLKACIHFLYLVPRSGPDYVTISDSELTWTNPMMEEFFLYAAEAWPIHYSESRNEHTQKLLQLCEELCSPPSSSFGLWTRHNNYYHLRFPPGRRDITGRTTDHAREVQRAFLGPNFSASSKFTGFVDSEDNDTDEDDVAQTEARKFASEVEKEEHDTQQEMSQSYRFKEYRKAEKKLQRENQVQSIICSNYTPSSYLNSVKAASYMSAGSSSSCEEV